MTSTFHLSKIFETPKIDEVVNSQKSDLVTPPPLPRDAFTYLIHFIYTWFGY